LFVADRGCLFFEEQKTRDVVLVRQTYDCTSFGNRRWCLPVPLQVGAWMHVVRGGASDRDSDMWAPLLAGQL
jgi:hypothetical protein